MTVTEEIEYHHFVPYIVYLSVAISYIQLEALIKPLFIHI